MENSRNENDAYYAFGQNYGDYVKTATAPQFYREWDDRYADPEDCYVDCYLEDVMSPNRHSSPGDSTGGKRRGLGDYALYAQKNGERAPNPATIGQMHADNIRDGRGGFVPTVPPGAGQSHRHGGGDHHHGQGHHEHGHGHQHKHRHESDKLFAPESWTSTSADRDRARTAEKSVQKYRDRMMHPRIPQKKEEKWRPDDYPRIDGATPPPGSISGWTYLNTPKAGEPSQGGEPEPTQTGTLPFAGNAEEGEAPEEYPYAYEEEEVGLPAIDAEEALQMGEDWWAAEEAMAPEEGAIAPPAAEAGADDFDFDAFAAGDNQHQTISPTDNMPLMYPEKRTGVDLPKNFEEATRWPSWTHHFYPESSGTSSSSGGFAVPVRRRAEERACGPAFRGRGRSERSAADSSHERSRRRGVRSASGGRGGNDVSGGSRGVRSSPSDATRRGPGFSSCLARFSALRAGSRFQQNPRATRPSRSPPVRCAIRPSRSPPVRCATRPSRSPPVRCATRPSRSPPARWASPTSSMSRGRVASSSRAAAPLLVDERTVEFFKGSDDVSSCLSSARFSTCNSDGSIDEVEDWSEDVAHGASMDAGGSAVHQRRSHVGPSTLVDRGSIDECCWTEEDTRSPWTEGHHSAGPLSSSDSDTEGAAEPRPPPLLFYGEDHDSSSSDSDTEGAAEPRPPLVFYQESSPRSDHFYREDRGHHHHYFYQDSPRSDYRNRSINTQSVLLPPQVLREDPKSDLPGDLREDVILAKNSPRPSPFPLSSQQHLQIAPLYLLGQKRINTNFHSQIYHDRENRVNAALGGFGSVNMPWVSPNAVDNPDRHPTPFDAHIMYAHPPVVGRFAAGQGFADAEYLLYDEKELPGLADEGGVLAGPVGGGGGGRGGGGPSPTVVDGQVVIVKNVLYKLRIFLVQRIKVCTDLLKHDEVMVQKPTCRKTR